MAGYTFLNACLFLHLPAPPSYLTSPIIRPLMAFCKICRIWTVHYYFAYYLHIVAYLFAYCCILFHIFYIFCILQYAKHAEYGQCTIILHIILHIKQIYLHIFVHILHILHIVICRICRIWTVHYYFAYYFAYYCIYMQTNMQNNSK
jgi:hypothetical protein